jgi:hypothetical protein
MLQCGLHYNAYTSVSCAITTVVRSNDGGGGEDAYTLEIL